MTGEGITSTILGVAGIGVRVTESVGMNNSSYLGNHPSTRLYGITQVTIPLIRGVLVMNVSNIESSSGVFGQFSG